jgi:hypothetical protein
MSYRHDQAVKELLCMKRCDRNYLNIPAFFAIIILARVCSP